jgi:hypothetical protein
MTANHFAWLACLFLVISALVVGIIDWFTGHNAEAQISFLKALSGLILLNQYAKLIDEKQ